jgi:hypothetical protein
LFPASIRVLTSAVKTASVLMESIENFFPVWAVDASKKYVPRSAVSLISIDMKIILKVSTKKFAEILPSGRY